MQINLIQLETNDERDAQVKWDQEEETKYKNRLSEIDTWMSFNAFRRATWEHGMKIMGMVEVDKPEKSRLCMRGFERKLYDADTLYRPTPFPASMSVLLVMAHTYVVPPPETDEPEGTIWKLLVTAYGLEDSMIEFDDHFSEVSSNMPNGFKRCSGDPTVFA